MGKTVLHLTDLHFGWDGNDENKLAERKVCLESLLAAIDALDFSWKPSIICVSGDIGWRGVADDYKEAQQWFNWLLDRCGIEYDHLILCPGNHDLLRLEAVKNARPHDVKEADEVLGVPIAAHYLKPFTAFTNFCQSAGVKPFSFGDAESYLVGVRLVEGLKFISLNSAWFAKDDKDKGRLWLGFPHLKYLEAQGQIKLIHGKPGLPVTIALLHHPKEWLHEAEMQVWETRQNPWDYLAHRCHVMLTGHTHNEVRPADRIAESAYHFTGGSAYAGSSHFNSFRLLKIDSGQIEYRSFEFDPRSAENTWTSSEARIIHLGTDGLTGSAGRRPPQDKSLLTNIRNALRSDASRFVDAKSRLLKLVGVLPRTVPQQVSVRVSAQLDRYDARGRLIREKNSEQIMPFYEAARGSRRTLLLGDLGTGKSVLGANLVIETLERSETAIAAIIPLKSLHLVGQFTIHDLLEAVDEYLSNQAAPTLEISLKDLLNSQVEVLLVLDGLDELDRNLATRLLSRAGSLPEHWPTIQIVVTGRPVELVGVAYADWRVVQTAPLNDDMKRQFLKEELLADGANPAAVDAQVGELLARLKALSALDALASSPLTIRLLSSRLRSVSLTTEDLTLGDLLYDLLMERLGIWATRDDKKQKFDEFEAAFPTPEAKSIYLSNLALKTVAGSKLTREVAKLLFESAATPSKNFNRFQLADEALAYFELAGLITCTESIEFLVQPLAEMAAAIGIAPDWSSKDNGWQLPGVDQWRVVSFVGTVSRRKGWLNKLREPILLYTQSILANPAQFPAACYIAVETKDEFCARKIVSMFTSLRRRPLTLLEEERLVSARNIALTVWLAKDSGFDWFYREYLDPKYPVTLLGVGQVEDVFTHWTSLAAGRLTDSEVQRLTALVRPYLATGEAQFFGVLSLLSLLVPEAFSIEDRLWFQSELLDNAFLGRRAADEIIAAATVGAQELVTEILMHRVGESTRATRLWFDLNPKAELSAPLIEAVFKSLTKARSKSDADLLMNLCRERLGNERWLWFARWVLLGEDNLASCGAAIALYNAGERRLQLLGRVLMRAMHDGGYVAEAEKILSALIKQQGEKGVRWLVLRMAEQDERLGGHSGWWRILLSEIEGFNDGPSLLASCIRSLGQFILPRYPEIREQFTSLLKGRRGQEFREALFRQIHSLDPRTRRAAAVTLVTIDPRHEGDALFMAVRSRAERLAIDWREWEVLCLSLDFGPSVLEQLKSRLNLLERESRALALAILAKGKIQLQPSYRDELLLSLLATGNWHLNVEGLGSMALASPDSQERLLQQLSRPGTELAERAAARLLEFHRLKLTLEQEAKCLALVTKRSRYSHDIVEQMLRIRRDAAFAEALGNVCEEIVEPGGVRPLLQLVLKANTDSKSWKDIVWTLLCDDSGIHRGSDAADDMGQALLDYGRDMPADAKFIGQAAKEWLNDERMRQNRWGDAHHWLGVLADEFAGLSQQELRDVLNRGGAIWYSAATALIGRLGEVPEGFHSHRASERLRPSRPVSQRWARDQLINVLRDYSRDSDDLHPNIVKAIEESLFLPMICEENLADFVATGNPGRLIATSLRYAYGQTANLAETIPLLDIWGRFYRPGYQQKKEERRLQQVWMAVRATSIYDDTVEKTKYLAALDSALVEGEVWKLPVALEILRIRGSLLPTQVSGVFRTYAAYTTMFHKVLFTELATWLSPKLDEDTKAAVLTGANEAIVILNEERWDRSDGSQRGPWAFLLFPVVTWILNGKSTVEVEAVFHRGIKFAFDEFFQQHRDAQSEVVSLIASLEPLLKNTSPEILRSTIRRGLESLDPAVRAFCQLISSFS